ncbi:class A beta-lactamase [Azospirillum sp. RWY-5-1]|uniref:Beta-lactamase n=1 Tax=Azospirillum oleiclasticum TaxID=2735135 RepID=A0ABX2TML9_9PROT|nr:class A beta-lactamase [Azospirillum oleiclasticum]NYZ17364.1 class A beta-lactamase [Azospirillum oleiclasticum]NYZ24694.1 class A beta-lactamase [Azospirillum oleiclasticum]
MPIVLTRRSFAALAGTLLAAGTLARPRLAASAPPDAFATAVAAIEKRVGARLGAAVLDTGTGRRWAYRGDERFPMCSTFKAAAAAAILARVDAGQEDLGRRIRYKASDLLEYAPAAKANLARGMTMGELCEAAVTLSDNTAANLMLTSMGGPAAFTSFLRSVGDARTRLDRMEPELNSATPGDPRDTTTPNAMTETLEVLCTGDALSETSRERFNGWLIATRTGDARIRAGLPKGWRAGDKTGTGALGTANDIAIAWPPGRAPVTIAVYLTECDGSLDARNAAIADVARLVPGLLGG